MTGVGVHATTGAFGGIVAVAFAVLVAQETRVPFVGSIAVDAAGAVLSPADLSEFMEFMGEDAKTFAFAGALVALFLLVVAAWLLLRPWRSPWTRAERAVALALVAAAVFSAVVGATAIVDLIVGPPLLSDREWAVHIGLSVGVGLVAAAAAQLAEWSVLATARETPVEPNARALTRRHLLSGTLALVASAVLSYEVARSVLSTTATGVRSRLPAGVLPSPITPTEQFYVVSKNLFDPDVDGAAWRLRIGGLVREAIELDLVKLQELGGDTHVQTLLCISNEVGGHLISTARWTGVPLAIVLDLADPSPAASHVLFRSADQYTDSLPMTAARDPATRLVWAMNDAPLTRAHGFPLRLLVPGRYGLKNPKWIEEIELIPAEVSGYWQQRGWSQDAFVRTMSRIDVPAASAAAQPRLSVQGIAFAGDRGIAGVDVSADGGASWQPAELTPPLSPLSWSMWATTVRPPTTGGELVVRAIDSSGAVQDATIRPPLPSGASGYHRRPLRDPRG